MIKPKPRRNDSRPKRRQVPAAARRSIGDRLKQIKLLLCDVDGVLTDGTVLIGGTGEMKRFSIHDGLGLRMLQRNGIKIGWISNRPSPVTLLRAEELKIDFLSQEKTSKVETVERILRETGLSWREVAYIGDDVVDLGVLRRAGAAFAPANGIAEAKKMAHHVTKNPGGRGAVREVVEMILKAQGRWVRLIEEYSA